MITELHASTTNGSFVELRGVHADFDSLPTDVANGSSFTEMDTGDTYHFDEESGTWV